MTLADPPTISASRGMNLTYIDNAFISSMALALPKYLKKEAGTGSSWNLIEYSRLFSGIMLKDSSNRSDSKLGSLDAPIPARRGVWQNIMYATGVRPQCGTSTWLLPDTLIVTMAEI